MISRLAIKKKGSVVDLFDIANTDVIEFGRVVVYELYAHDFSGF
jgi:hypothetical protein